MSKKVNMFGKGIPVFAIVILGLALVSAALLTYFGVITGLVTVTSQGLLVDDLSYPKSSSIVETWDGTTFTSLDSKTFVGGHSLTNLVDRNVIVDLKTSIDCTVDPLTCKGVTYEYVKGVTSGSLFLDNKDPTTWKVIPDGISGGLSYSTDGTKFTYSLIATGLPASKSYVLIYYADKQDRFTNWGGDNPGALIATVTTDGSGVILASGTKDLGTVLPNPSDWNANPNPNYCSKNNGYDNYEHCLGAKIWLVPASDYSEATKKLTAWHPSEYLFETDLITSFGGNLESPVTVPAGTTVNFGIKCVFQKGLLPDTFTIRTEVNPTA